MQPNNVCKKCHAEQLENLNSPIMQVLGKDLIGYGCVIKIEGDALLYMSSPEGIYVFDDTEQATRYLKTSEELGHPYHPDPVVDPLYFNDVMLLLTNSAHLNIAYDAYSRFEQSSMTLGIIKENEVKLPEAKEGYDVFIEFELEFSCRDPNKHTTTTNEIPFNSINKTKPIIIKSSESTIIHDGKTHTVH